MVSPKIKPLPACIITNLPAVETKKERVVSLPLRKGIMLSPAIFP